MALLIPPPKADRYLNVLELPENASSAAVIQQCRELLKNADERLQKDFIENAEITRLVQTRAWLVEKLVLHLWHHFLGKDKARKLALVAAGGFGRGDLQPRSDVDLLILSERDTPRESDTIGTFIQSLWDIGLDVGHATRTPKECLAQGKNDVTVATNLMEARFISGQHSLFARMRALTGPDNLWPGDKFFAAKLAEQKERHRRHGATAYSLEPNIKEGPGGLRDIQMVGWVAHRHFNTQSLHGLVDAGFLEEHEYLALQKGRRWLWKLRFALHQLAGRKEDRLLFDYQPQLARLFGYLDEGNRNQGVEQFMQAYYRRAMRLERLNHRLLQLFDENILKASHPIKTTRLDAHFQVVNDFIEAIDPNVFRHHPESWFGIFLHLQNNPGIQGIRASTVRAMRRHIDQVARTDFRKNPTVQTQFLQIVKNPRRVTEQLLRMNRLGILGRYIPAWKKIVGRMQYDLFHVYTVDQHNLFVVRNLRLLRLGKTGLEFAEKQMQEVENPYLLYLAGLFHDIAKGREGPHAVLGAIDAREFAQAHRLPEADAELLEWLVRHHLVFSVTAQKKDLSDPQVIEKFAAIVGSLDRLRALYLLTIADIAGTDPKLWNDFKDSLMRELFVKTEAVLKNRHQTDLQELRRGNRQASEDLLATAGVPGWQRFIRQLPDHVFYEGLFYHVASALQHSGYDVLQARVSSTSDGHALDFFLCQPTRQAIPAEKVQQRVETALQDRRAPAARATAYTPRRLRHFHITPQVHLKPYENDPSEHVMEVVCSDRPGVLADIAQTLLRHQAEIHGAKIATFGNRVEDTFWISAHGGKPLSAGQQQNISHALKEKLNEPR